MLILQSHRLKKKKGRYTWVFSLRCRCCHSDSNRDGAAGGEWLNRESAWEYEGAACGELALWQWRPAHSGSFFAGRHWNNTHTSVSCINICAGLFTVLFTHSGRDLLKPWPRESAAVPTGSNLIQAFQTDTCLIPADVSNYWDKSQHEFEMQH